VIFSSSFVSCVSSRFSRSCLSDSTPILVNDRRDLARKGRKRTPAKSQPEENWIIRHQTQPPQLVVVGLCDLHFSVHGGGCFGSDDEAVGWWDAGAEDVGLRCIENQLWVVPVVPCDLLEVYPIA